MFVKEKKEVRTKVADEKREKCDSGRTVCFMGILNNVKLNIL